MGYDYFVIEMNGGIVSLSVSPYRFIMLLNSCCCSLKFISIVCIVERLVSVICVCVQLCFNTLENANCWLNKFLSQSAKLNLAHDLKFSFDFNQRTHMPWFLKKFS